MHKNEARVAKWCLFGVLIKQYPNLAKAYLCLAAGGFYGIRAAREANNLANAAFEKLNEERKRPVVVVEG